MRAIPSLMMTGVISAALLLGGCANSPLGAGKPAAQAVNYAQLAAQYLPGKWSFAHEIAPGVMLEGTSTYAANGTAIYKGALKGNGRAIPIHMRGNWRVEGNKITTKVTESSLPNLVPVGTESTDTINYIRADEWSYTGDEEKITIVEKRVSK